MTSKRRRPTSRSAARESVELTRQAVERVRSDPTDITDIDAASALFFQFAGPLLMTARDEAEFQTAASLAEFVWTTTFFDAATQATMLDDFIEQSNMPESMVPWLLEVYEELAARKEAMLG